MLDEFLLVVIFAVALGFGFTNGINDAANAVAAFEAEAWRATDNPLGGTQRPAGKRAPIDRPMHEFDALLGCDKHGGMLTDNVAAADD